MSKSCVGITGSCLNIVLENLLVDASVMMTTNPFWTFWSYVNVSSSGWAGCQSVLSALPDRFCFNNFNKCFHEVVVVFMFVCVDLLVYHYTPTTIAGS